MKQNLRNLRKAINVGAALVLVLFALLQLNDPDPILWGYAYLAPAGLAILALRYPLDRNMIWLISLGYLAGALQFWPGNVSAWWQAEQQAKGLEMSLPFIEEARESLGLLLTACLVLVVGLPGESYGWGRPRHVE